ncbi:hypothetical protein DID78_00915 [Candidatus Marinamargulisbacteria bacterium SCGC AG-343-D04]|nr:hypothetical protein DID78_00915 [Candidatus Marinamargulisbacteria bacterium SCGC AG-343-D04]
MLWKEPNKDTPCLYLPISQANPLKSIHDCFIDPQFSCPVDTQFITSWHSPTLDSPKQVCLTLLTLLHPLATLIKKEQQNIKTYEKSAPHDVVTEMDIGIELLLRYWFKKHLPTHKIIGEEGKKEQISAHDIIWYLDPIDGTSNYSKQSSNYCINLGSTYKGKPYINIVYKPDTHQHFFSTPEHSNYTHLQKQSSHICTEFYPHRKTEKEILAKILEQKNLPLMQTQALGVSLFNMIQGKGSVFYKYNVKPWDVIAPLGILAHSDYWDISLSFNQQELSPFSNSPEMLSHLNNAFQHNCRIGLIIICPKHSLSIKKLIQTIVAEYE